MLLRFYGGLVFFGFRARLPSFSVHPVYQSFDMGLSLRLEFGFRALVLFTFEDMFYGLVFEGLRSLEFRALWVQGLGVFSRGSLMIEWSARGLLPGTASRTTYTWPFNTERLDPPVLSS